MLSHVRRHYDLIASGTDRQSVSEVASDGTIGLSIDVQI